MHTKVHNSFLYYDIVLCRLLGRAKVNRLYKEFTVFAGNNQPRPQIWADIIIVLYFAWKSPEWVIELRIVAQDVSKHCMYVLLSHVCRVGWSRWNELTRAYWLGLAHYAQNLSYYAILLCSKTLTIMLPSLNHYAPKLNHYAHRSNLWPYHVIYHVAKLKVDLDISWLQPLSASVELVCF